MIDSMKDTKTISQTKSRKFLKPSFNYARGAKVNIAGIQIDIQSTIPFKTSKKLNCFSSINVHKADISLHIVKSSDIEVPDKTIELDEKMYWSGKSNQKEDISIYLYDPEIDQYTHHLKVSPGWDNALLTSKEEKADVLANFYGSLGEILFRNHLLFHQGLVIHSAAVEWRGKGIIFSAPSGTGKTTQANLWKKYKNAKILNADRPAIRVIEDKSYVYGTIWNGSSKKYSNHSVPLSAIVILEQAQSNTISKLEISEAIKRLMPRCFLPYCHEEIMNLAIDNLEKIITVTPVYLLQCRPDREAVELVYQCLK